jgi:Protein of unknown function (DUF1553)/Protein of unknown function (DUF1549)/Concanavalin A-like lectin/glucanases superfamily/Planctomycete cytochrome C
MLWDGSVLSFGPLVRLLTLGALSAAAYAAAPTASLPPVDFSREVRPILSDKCYHCHGPDEKGRKAQLRFDTKEGAFRIKDGSSVIIPGHSAESELVFRIKSTDEDEIMPPPEAKLGRLTPAEVATLQRWIDEGAKYQTHWSLEPLAPVTPPAATKFGARPAATSPIDHFTFAGLARRQLNPQPEADRVTLIRRLAFDLTGLPPALTDIDAFVADRAPDALPRLIDRLLASPRYGERMAADWLDLARYADSYGFQVDRERDMWPWRDWVIKAFNENLTWDKFVTYQIAGDLLPHATDEQILATAFNRLHAQEAEGGSIEEEYRINHVNDRVTTFGTAFLGLTLECCRCHDHKFDPISQKDFYALSAFFQNIDEAGLYSYFTQSVPTPALRLSDDTQQGKYNDASAAITKAVSELAVLRDTRREAFKVWLAQPPAARAVLRDELARFDFDQRDTTPLPPKPATADKTKTPAAEPLPPEDKPVELARFANALTPADYAITSAANTSVPGRPGAGQALKLSGDDAVKTKVGNFHRHEPFTLSLWLQTPEITKRAVILHRSRAWTDAGSRGYEILLEEGRPKWSLIHFWPGDAVSIRALDPLPLNQWVHLTVSNDGSSRAAGLKIYINGQPVRTEIIRDHLTKDITGGGGDTIDLGERFRDRGFKGGLIDDLRVFGRALTAVEVSALYAPDQLATTSNEAWFETYLANQDAPYRAQLAALTAARGTETQLVDAAKEIMVMRELPTPKTAYILKRGEYDQHGAAVLPDTPSALPPFPADQPRNRLGLAHWLTDARHPLLARVTVNRFWQSLFGQGLVKTVDDFGNQGDRAEYPELLDWLAGEFIRSGWDVKALLKTIVLSETYRQRSFATPEIMADDPENIWLARGPRHRLAAEMIRDQALATSGLLVEKIGGPPVFTYDIPESFKPAPAGKGEQLYRRSVYTFWRRTGPAPMLEAFDVPKRVVCVARRDTTNTALQALVLLNGPQFVEASRVLAENLYRAHAGQPDSLLADAFRRLTLRAPDPAEQKIIARLFDEQLTWFRAHPADAAKHLALGETPRDAKLPTPEIAALATVVNTLMNHDAFAVKR